MGKLLDEYLLLHNQSQETISKGLYNKLLKVENEIIRRQQLSKEAYESIKSNSINVKAIAEATSISRKTFYNNELLNNFVISNSSNNDSSKEELKRTKEKLRESDCKVKKLVEKDVDVEKMKYTITKLETELSFARQRIKSLERQLSESNISSEDLYNYKHNNKAYFS